MLSHLIFKINSLHNWRDQICKLDINSFQDVTDFEYVRGRYSNISSMTLDYFLRALTPELQVVFLDTLRNRFGGRKNIQAIHLVV